MELAKYKACICEGSAENNHQPLPVRPIYWFNNSFHDYFQRISPFPLFMLAEVINSSHQ